VTIPGAEQHRFDRMGRARVATVLSGKLRVRLDGEDEFIIGERGRFRIEARQGCLVTNLLYVDGAVMVNVVGEMV
jgi:hypothetical protein